MKYLTRQEELVLLTIYQLGEKSYLVSIREKLIEVTGKEWSISSVYMPLNKLTRDGYLKTFLGSPLAKRGGKAIKYYQLTKKSAEALNEIMSMNKLMWKGVKNIVVEG